MKGKFVRNLVAISLIHLVLVLGLAVVTVLQGCRRGKPVTMTYLPVEFVVEMPVAAVVPQAPKDIPEPAPAVKRPAKPKPRQRPVRKPRRVQKRVSQSHVEKMLNLGPTPNTTSRQVRDDTMYRAIIEQTFWNAWKQPSYSDVGDAIAAVSIRLREDGTLIDHALKSSGNAILDSSVRRAVRSVRRVPGLSGDYVKRHKVIELTFRVEEE